MILILPNNIEKGLWAEKLALRYLRRQGLHCRHKHYDCRLNKNNDCKGELDLIMQWGRLIIFVEVRYRQNGGALKSVNQKKQDLLRCCADEYCKKQKLIYLRKRFDIVFLEGKGENVMIHWQKNAFPVLNNSE